MQVCWKKIQNKFIPSFRLMNTLQIFQIIEFSKSAIYCKHNGFYSGLARSRSCWNLQTAVLEYLGTRDKDEADGE